jgi:nicotinamide-nucleotide amidase
MDLDTLAREVGQELASRGLTLTTAESCTGGWVAQVLTSVPGSSDWFERGVVTYSNLSKEELLGVAHDLLARHGAVSEPVACAMAEGALARSPAQLALAVTGIAGPAGGTPTKPVGTVCLAWAGNDRATVSITKVFSGTRDEIRRQAVELALAHLLQCVRLNSRD